KFVSPTTAGTTDSAALGALTVMLLMPAAPPLLKIAVAFVFALAGTMLFMRLLGRIKLRDPVLIALVGLMFGNIIGAGTTFLALKHDMLQSIGAWLQGDFSAILRGRYELLYLSVPMIAVAYAFASRFTIAGMGEQFAA